MRITGIVWLRDIVDKLDWKHHVSPEEVEQVLESGPRFRKLERGHVAGEDLYTAMGHTDAGRYLIVFFLHKSGDEALVVSAREMTTKEKRQYGK